MSGILQAMINKTTEIGDPFGGGYYAGLISTSANGIADYVLVVAPVSSGQTTTTWGPLATSTGATSFIDGPGNSALLNNSSYPAAFFCKGLTIGGFSDWYLPAFDELEICYFNLKPTTQNNTTSQGINNYSVPKRTSNYTTTNPGQTSATDFKSTGTQAFSSSNYWSSTESTTIAAYVKRFTDGQLIGNQRNFSTLTRAVRRIPI